MTPHEIAKIEKLWPKERWPFRKLAMRICNKFIKDFDNQFHKLPYEIMDVMGFIIEIESALTQAHEEERNALADKLEEMAIATYGQKIIEPIPISSDILLAWVKPLRSGERAFGPSPCLTCHHEISSYCTTCFEKAKEEGRKEMRETCVKVALEHSHINVPHHRIQECGKKIAQKIRGLK